MSTRDDHQQRAYFAESGGFVGVDIHDGRLVAPGQDLFGPLIIEEPTTTIVVPPGWKITLQEEGFYLLSR